MQIFRSGIEFISSELYTQYKKACLFNDLNTISEILRTEIPLEAKHLGKKVKDFNLDQWKEEGLTAIETGITAKFLQNENLHRCLLATINKLLAEASVDTLWGIGLQLHDKDILNRSKWISFGWMSKVLMKIRDENPLPPLNTN